MTLTEKIITIGAVVFGTMITRFLPFLIFPDKKTPPKWIIKLGAVLPYAMMGMLVIFSLKDVQFSQFSYGIPEIIAILITISLHLWKRNMLLSISAGTLSYMTMVQYIFV